MIYCLVLLVSEFYKNDALVCTFLGDLFLSLNCIHLRLIHFAAGSCGSFIFHCCILFQRTVMYFLLFLLPALPLAEPFSETSFIMTLSQQALAAICQKDMLSSYFLYKCSHCRFQNTCHHLSCFLICSFSCSLLVFNRLYVPQREDPVCCCHVSTQHSYSHTTINACYYFSQNVINIRQHGIEIIVPEKMLDGLLH